MPEIDLSKKEYQRIEKMREQARIKEQKEKEKQLLEANLSDEEYQSIIRTRERMQNLRQRKQVINQQKTIMVDGRFVSVPKNSLEYPYCPKCEEHVVHPFYNGCPKCETPVIYDDGKTYPFSKEMIAEREKQRIRDEKYQSASKFGKFLISLEEFGKEFAKEMQSNSEYRGLGGSSNSSGRTVPSFYNESHWMQNRLNNWAREHGWSSYRDYETDK